MTTAPDSDTHRDDAPLVERDPALPPLVARSALGGVLMGLANLVPGISGGTMLLAAGIYPRFIAAIGEVTTLKFRRASVAVLGTVVIAAMLAIVLFAGAIKELVVHQRWAMYSVFIGLTLGGVPVVWRLVQRVEGRGSRVEENTSHAESRPTPPNPQPASRTALWLAAFVGFAAMAALALVQSSGAAGAGSNTGFVFMLLAGVAGAAAMILPGVSGGYLLLVLGVYVPILAGIDAFKDALSAKDVTAALDVGFKVILPVGIGVLIGVVGVSNLLRWLLRKYELATLGVLLGLLLGAVVGLWPFQQSVKPNWHMTIKGRGIAPVPLEYFIERGYELKPGDVVHGEAEGKDGDWIYTYSDTDDFEPIAAEDLPTEFFTPTAAQAAGSVGLILLGFAVTMGVDRLGREKPGR